MVNEFVGMPSRYESREAVDKYLLGSAAVEADALDMWGSTEEAQAEMDRFMTI